MHVTIAIIGGGAAGVAAAITAAESGARVIVLERNRRPLKKLGVTGNGRGNLLNAGPPVYYGDPAFARDVLHREGYPELRAFFASVGVSLREEAEGRVYPAALQASVAVEALLLRAAQLGVQWMTQTEVLGIAREGAAFTLRAAQTEPEPEPLRGGKPPSKPARRPEAVPRAVTLRADRVIVTVGGAAAPVHGTDGRSYGLLTGFGHPISPLRPALCALRTEPARVAGLAGQRVRAGLALVARDGRTLHRAEGEVLFGEDAVSGIAAMQLARFTQDGAVVALDLRPAAGWDGAPETGSGEAPDGMTAAVTRRLRALASLRADRPLRDLLTGVFASPVARLICREAGLSDPGLPIARLCEGELERIAATVACLRLPVLGTRGFDQAQVTAGGAATAAFDPATMQSRLCGGLYAAGEVLDVDGDCGGFNLMFAFAGGRLAGRAAARG